MLNSSVSNKHPQLTGIAFAGFLSEMFYHLKQLNKEREGESWNKTAPRLVKIHFKTDRSFCLLIYIKVQFFTFQHGVKLNAVVTCSDLAS